MSHIKSEMTIISHLQELRNRLLTCLAVIIAFFCVSAYFNQLLYHLLALPLTKHLNPSSTMIVTHLVEPLTVPLKLSFIVAVFVSLPVLFYQLWAFIYPGLYPHEKLKIWPYVLTSLFLFYLGVAFAYFVGFPLLFNFFVKLTPANIHLLPDMSQYLDLCLQLFVAFGIVFETPLITYALIQSGWITTATINESRRYVIVLAFIVGMLLTPPDVVSQIMLAIPMWFLFELGVLAAYLVNLTKLKNQQPLKPKP